MFNNRTILITGGTGLFGKKYTKKILENYTPQKIIIFSRGELKQFEMQSEYSHECMRYFLGDIRDYERLLEATEGVDYIIHAASMKHLNATEYNPFECVKTNIYGAENVIKAAIKNNVKKVIALSVDRVAYPKELNDATRLTSEKLFVAANNMVGSRETRFSVVRYNTLVGEDESIFNYLQSEDKQKNNKSPFIKLIENGVEFTLKNFERMQGGEVFVPKYDSKQILGDEVEGVEIGSYNILANVEKNLVLEFDDHHIICPSLQFANISDFTKNKLGEVGRVIAYGKQDINQADVNAVVEVLRSDFLTQGPKVPMFEESIADYCQAKFATAVNSATSALHIACLAIGVKKGDWVWTSANTFVASANCALYCGANIDFIDINPQTYNLCENALEEKLYRAEKQGILPKVVIPVHFAGQSCNMKKIRKLSLKFGFRVIEDASHAIGGKYLDEPIGSCTYSDITVFSFHPVKIVTTGEGGVAVTNNSDLFEKMSLLRSHGVTRDPNLMDKDPEGDWYYQQIDLGFNYRMTEMQAALGISQLNRLDKFVDARHKLRIRYDKLLAALPVKVPFQSEDCYSSVHLYPILLNNEELNKTHKEIFHTMRQKGIGVNLHYIPVYRHPYFSKFNIDKSDFVNAESYYSRAISIPMYHGLSKNQQDRVISALQEALAD